MPVDIALIVTIAAILVMIYALWLAIAGRKEIPGGMVGKHWGVLTGLVALFAVGYIAIPLLGDLSADTLRLIVACIFLFGAVYVVITIKLIRKIIAVLSE